jgi:hypothetical protein
MDVTVDGTLFLLDLDSLEVTICTWGGEEARLPVVHLCALVDHLRSLRVPLPDPLPAVTVDADEQQLEEEAPQKVCLPPKNTP